MLTILITGNDTEIGKSRTVRTLAELFTHQGSSVQIVKPMECCAAHLEKPDAERSAEDLSAEAHTLVSVRDHLLPITQPHFTVAMLAERLDALPPRDVRLIEGRGGIASPLDPDGKDLKDLSKLIKIDYAVLVVEDRLGAINQARLVEAYAEGIAPACGFWLSEAKPTDAETKAANRANIAMLKTPIWGEVAYGSAAPDVITLPCFRLSLC